MEIIDPCQNPDWDREVLLHPEATPFHTSNWAKVLCKTYGHIPRYLRFAKDGKLVALIPFMEVRSWLTGIRGVCLPFADFCQPLWFQANVQGAVFEAVREIGRNFGWKHLELRGEVESHISSQPAVTFRAHTLPLVGRDAQFASFSSSTRRAVRRANRSGLQVKVLTSVDGLRQYYKLHLLTRQRHGAPPQPFHFFENLHKSFMESGAGFCVVSLLNDELVAAAVFLHTGRSAIYKFGASNERFQHLRGNNLVMWEGIQTLARMGCKTLHFGRTDVANLGLSHFKQGWGSKEYDLEYFRINPESGEWLTTQGSLGGWRSRFFQRLPISMHKTIGKALYPHLD